MVYKLGRAIEYIKSWVTVCNSVRKSHAIVTLYYTSQFTILPQSQSVLSFIIFISVMLTREFKIKNKKPNFRKPRRLSNESLIIIKYMHTLCYTKSSFLFFFWILFFIFIFLLLVSMTRYFTICSLPAIYVSNILCQEITTGSCLH